MDFVEIYQHINPVHPALIVLLKILALVTFLFIILKIIAKHHGIRKNVRFDKVSVKYCNVGHSDQNSRGCRIPSRIVQKYRLESRYLHERVAHITMTEAEQPNNLSRFKQLSFLPLIGKKVDQEPVFEGDFNIIVPTRDTRDEICIDAQSWRELKEVMQPGPGRPEKVRDLFLRIETKDVTTVRFLLLRHPNREARMTAWITLLTSLYALASTLLLG